MKYRTYWDYVSKVPTGGGEIGSPSFLTVECEAASARAAEQEARPEAERMFAVMRGALPGSLSFDKALTLDEAAALDRSNAVVPRSLMWPILALIVIAALIAIAVSLHRG